MRYKHIAGASALALVLGAPFALKTVAPALEPYPAIIYPAGAGVVDTRENLLRSSRVELVGFDPASGQEQIVEIQPFLSPIPVQYFRDLTSREFGLQENLSLEIDFRILPLKTRTVVRRPITPEARDEAREWLRGRLDKAGLDPHRLLIRTSSLVIDARSGAELERKVTNEKNLGLD